MKYNFIFYSILILLGIFLSTLIGICINKKYKNFIDTKLKFLKPILIILLIIITIISLLATIQTIFIM
ncbi:MAG: hypothetical protein KFW09_05150 [Oscillospiraceae bacterium]|nr:hypothetical protein [Oscillospiraceae bacterium]